MGGPFVTPTVLLMINLMSLGLPTASLARLRDPDLASQDPSRPHLTHCLSRDMETFKCWWTPGNVQNLSQPRALRLFYSIPTDVRRECPHYSIGSGNECFFSRNFTHVWTPYDVELRSVEHNITYDSRKFNVEEIVEPDAPVNLTWSLLNVSLSGLYFDVMVRWEPPPSAAVGIGWISLVYQVQYRQVNTSHWEALNQESGRHQPIYSLQTDKTYEVRVRCQMRGYRFGLFSNSTIVQIGEIPNKDASFPMMLVMVFGVVGMVILLMTVVFSQQQRLMVIFLPPVPAPKIKGVDSELLKKGKLDDLNSILTSQHMYKPDMFRDEPWVEFIELDMDEPGDKTDASDTERLLGGFDSVGIGGSHGCLSSSHALNLKDDDSGHASCYDQELTPHTPQLEPVLLPKEHHHHPKAGRQDRGLAGDGVANANCLFTNSPIVGADSGASLQSTPHVAAPGIPTDPNATWASIDFYAQVSDVTPTGGVVLSPGSLIQQGTGTTKKEKKEKEMKEDGVTQTEAKGEKTEDEKDGKEEEEEEKKKKLMEMEEEGVMKFHLLVVNPDGGYTSEPVAPHTGGDNPLTVYQSSVPPPSTHCPAPFQTEPLSPGGYTAPPPMPGEYQQHPHMLPDASPPVPHAPMPLPPLSDYTVVQDVDIQHSLLLNAPSPTSAAATTPGQTMTSSLAKHLPAMPAMPMGYLSPDMLATITP